MTQDGKNMKSKPFLSRFSVKIFLKTKKFNDSKILNCSVFVKVSHFHTLRKTTKS